MVANGTFGRLLRSSVKSLMTPAEDPRTAYIDPRRQRHELLGEIEAALARLDATKHRLMVQRDESAAREEAFEVEARTALIARRDDLARSALERQRNAAGERDQLDRQIAALTREEEALLLAGRRMSAQIEAAHSREQLAAARQTAVRAQVAAAEALTGCTPGELEAIDDETERLECRAEAIDGLLAAGILGAGRRTEMDSLDPEIEERMARMKLELLGTPADGR
jgi:phage shock protein A